MKNKVCIFTINIDGYDNLKEPTRRVPGADYFLITDNSYESIPGFKTIIVDKGSNPIKTQRAIKIYPYDLLPGYDIYIYYDASFRIVDNLGDLISRFKGGLGVLRHPTRDCVFQEGERIIELGKAEMMSVREQLNYYAMEGMPHNYGLQATGILIRDASEQTKVLCKAWDEQVKEFTHRDQLGLPFAIFKTGIQPVYIHKWMLGGAFKQYPHKERTALTAGRSRIAYIQPFASNLNIGEEYNYHCSKVSHNDWICVLDQDFMFPYPKTKAQIEDVVNGVGRGFDLIGCLTNRIGSSHQCYNGVRSEDPDIRNHYKIAKKLHEQHYGEIKPIRQGIAGFFMLMPFKTWERFKFAENSISFDSVLSANVLKSNGKVGLLTGVYGFHYYRFDSANPQYEYDHLKS